MRFIGKQGRNQLEKLRLENRKVEGELDSAGNGQEGGPIPLHHEYKFFMVSQAIKYYMSDVAGRKIKNPCVFASGPNHRQLRLQTCEQQYRVPVNNSNKCGVKNQKAKNLAKFTGASFLSELGATKNKKRSLHWSPLEDEVLFSKYAELGSKWVQLARHLPQKSDNDIKNRFYSQIKKVQHRLNRVQKEHKIKSQKLISYTSLLTVLQIGKIELDLSDRRFDDIRKNLSSILDSRRLIFEIARQPQHMALDEKTITLVHKLIGLKHCLKFINSERVKRCADKNLSSLSGTNSSSGEQMVDSQDNRNGLKQETKKIETPNQPQTTDYSQLLDLQLLSGQLLSFSKPGSTSLIESCKDVLCASLVNKQRNDHLFLQ